MSGLYDYIKPLLARTKEKSKSKVSSIEFVPTNYPSDLNDEEWKVIEHLFPYGNQSDWHKRSLVNAVLYIDKTGCQWRQLPKNFPPYGTVWSFFHRARDKGIWAELNMLLVKETRIKAGRNESPTYTLTDSQSAKTTSANEERGIDGGKKIKGRKRHIVTDTMGNLLAIKVHAANIHDTKSGINAFRIAKERYSTIIGNCADQGYRKTYENQLKEEFDIVVDISARIKNEFVIQPKRWVVERTLAWLNGSRRLSKDYEIIITSQEAFVMISHSHTLLKRLCIP